MAEVTLTKGQKIVRVTFNPNENPTVTKIKQLSADLLDLVEELPINDYEVPRLKALAKTAYEEGCMWAVKAATA